VTFNEAKFTATADFSLAQFQAGASFERCGFDSSANFAETKFSALVSFRGNSTERVFGSDAIFSSVSLEKDTLHFVNVNLTRAHFLDSDVRRMAFVGVQWCRVGGRRGVYEEKLISDEVGKPSHADIENLYRQLKQNYEERRDFDSAGDFHAGEKEMRLRNSNTPRSMKCMLWLYKWTCGYGESFTKPFWWFAGLIFLVSGISISVGGLINHAEQPLAVSSPTDWVSAIFFALSESFHLRVDHLTVHNSIWALQILAGTMGPLFVGLFGLAVRNKLRR
jgi:hypothetical protein